MQPRKLGYSTSAEVLAELAPQPGCPPVVRHIMAWRGNEKLHDFLRDIKSERLPKCLPLCTEGTRAGRPPVMRLSCNVMQAVVDTGRLAMDNPNLQARPQRAARSSLPVTVD